MLRQLLERALGARRAEEQEPIAEDDAPDARDEASRRPDTSIRRPPSEQTTRVASRKVVGAAVPSKYPLSWPARDLARSRRLQSPSEEATALARRPGADPGDGPDDDPTVVWRPDQGKDGNEH